MPKIKRKSDNKTKPKKIKKPKISDCELCPNESIRGFSSKSEGTMTELDQNAIDNDDNVEMFFPWDIKELCFKHLKEQAEEFIDNKTSFKIEFSKK